jgi:two-component system, chemotaxis family, chemotaxis protein CheY
VRILVVDDDPAFVEMVRAVLVEGRHEVAAVGDGSAALGVVSTYAPDVILLDLRMPRMDGPAFARLYSRIPGPHAPIVVLSAALRASPSNVPGALGQLSKPFEIDDLLGLLDRVVS